MKNVDKIGEHSMRELLIEYNRFLEEEYGDVGVRPDNTHIDEFLSESENN